MQLWPFPPKDFAGCRLGPESRSTHKGAMTRFYVAFQSVDLAKEVVAPMSMPDPGPSGLFRTEKGEGTWITDQRPQDCIPGRIVTR